MEMTIKYIRCMDYDVKVFVAWLRKILKDDKKIKAKDLASAVGCDPSTISGYIRGRTKPDDVMCEAILSVVGENEKRMVEIGSRVITENEAPKISQEIEDLKKRMDVLEVTSTTKANPIHVDQKNILDLSDPVKTEHYKLINRFPDKIKGLELNKLGVELAIKDPKGFEEIISIMKIKLGNQTVEPQHKNGTTGQGEH